MEGKNLVLSFYQDSKVEIKYGEKSYPLKGIEVDAETNLMRIEYYATIGGEVVAAEYSFSLKSLSEQMGKIPCEMPLEEGQTHVWLKESLFRLFGYDVLEELEGRIGRDAGEDRRVILRVHFDNGKVAYCGSKELIIHVPPGARSIASIEIVAFKELEDIKQLAIRVLDNPENTDLKRELGRAITEKYLMDSILDEISRRSGIPKDKLRVRRLGEEERGGKGP